MADCEAALARLCDAAAKVSAHYLIRRDGHIFQLVDEAARAWHGAFWQGETDMNSASSALSLTMTGIKTAKWTLSLEMAALIKLLKVTARYAIAPQNILGHSDIAPGRKIDREAFDWAALHQAGFGLWLDNVTIQDVPPLALGSEDKAVAPLQKALAAIGYHITADGVFGVRTQTSSPPFNVISARPKSTASPTPKRRLWFMRFVAWRESLSYFTYCASINLLRIARFSPVADCARL